MDKGGGDGELPAAAAASFLVLQQRTAYEVFPSERRVSGATVLDVLVRDQPGSAPPAGAQYRVPLHARQMAVLEVLVDGAPAVFDHADCRVEVLPLDADTRASYVASPAAVVAAAEETKAGAEKEGLAAAVEVGHEEDDHGRDMDMEEHGYEIEDEYENETEYGDEYGDGYGGGVGEEGDDARMDEELAEDGSTYGTLLGKRRRRGAAPSLRFGRLQRRRGPRQRNAARNAVAAFSVLQRASTSVADMGGELAVMVAAPALVRRSPGSAFRVSIEVRFAIDRPAGGLHFSRFSLGASSESGGGGGAGAGVGGGGGGHGRSEEEEVLFGDGDGVAVYTDALDGGARLWMPCAELQAYPSVATFTVARGLSVFASGKLCARYALDDGRECFEFSTGGAAVRPAECGFVVAPLLLLPDDHDPRYSYAAPMVLRDRLRATVRPAPMVRALLEHMLRRPEQELPQLDPDSLDPRVLPLDDMGGGGVTAVVPPYPHHALVFLPNLSRRIVSARGLTLLDADEDLFDAATELDYGLSVRLRIALGMALQWTAVVPRFGNYADAVWMSHGLAYFLALRVYRAMFGNSEYLAAVYKIAEEARAAHRSGDSFPLSPQFVPDGPVQLHSKWSRRVSALVFHSIHQKLGAEAFSSLLFDILPQRPPPPESADDAIFAASASAATAADRARPVAAGRASVDAEIGGSASSSVAVLVMPAIARYASPWVPADVSSDMLRSSRSQPPAAAGGNLNLTTAWSLKGGAVDIGGVDDGGFEEGLNTSRLIALLRSMTLRTKLEYFAEVYILSAGFPALSAGFHYESKKQSIEMAVRHELQLPHARHFLGSFDVGFHETDLSYRHPVPFGEVINIVRLDVHSRQRRRQAYRNPRSRKSGGIPATETEAMAMAGGDDVADMPPVDIEMSDLRDFRNRDVPLFGDRVIATDMRTRRNDCPVQWLRIDPYYEYPLLEVRFRQPQNMWFVQLAEDTNAVAQIEAIRSLVRDYPDRPTVLRLYSVLRGEEVYYRVRMEAARALGTLGHVNNFIGLNALLDFYRDRYFDPSGTQLLPTRALPLDRYFVKQAVIEGIGRVRDGEGYTPALAVNFLIQILNENDNSLCRRSDAALVSTIIGALAMCEKTQTGEEFATIRLLLERLIKMGAVTPGPHFRVLRAALGAHSAFQVRGVFRRQPSLFEQFLQPSFPGFVRRAALRALVRVLATGSPAGVLAYTGALLLSDVDPSLRRRVAVDLRRSLAPDGEPPMRAFCISSTASDTMMTAVWAMLDSASSAYDQRLRHAAVHLFRALYSDMPRSPLNPEYGLAFDVMASAAPAIDEGLVLRNESVQRNMRREYDLSDAGGVGSGAHGDGSMGDGDDGSAAASAAAAAAAAAVIPMRFVLSNMRASISAAAAISKADVDGFSPPATTPVTPRMRFKFSN